MPRSLPFLKVGRVAVRTFGRIHSSFWPGRCTRLWHLRLFWFPKPMAGRGKANPLAVVSNPRDSEAGWAAARVGLGP